MYIQQRCIKQSRMCSKRFVEEAYINLKIYLVFLLCMLLLMFYIHKNRAKQHNPANIVNPQVYLHSSKLFTSTENLMLVFY